VTGRNLILTGLPRSGTTLVCALIDSLRDAVCLSEPDWQDAWPREMNDRPAYAERIRQDFARVREVLLGGGEVSDRRAANGSAVTNYFPLASDGSRQPAYALQPFRRSGLSADFLLGMKQNAHYSCILDELARHEDFTIVAIVRHPLATIGSWRSAARLPIGHGRLPAAERFWPEIAHQAASTPDILLRQVGIYRLFCERYRALGSRIHLLRYEDIVDKPELLSAICGRDYVRTVEVNPTALPAGNEEMDAIARCVREHCAVASELYPDLI
jgi:hypothetical protein